MRAASRFVAGAILAVALSACAGPRMLQAVVPADESPTVAPTASTAGDIPVLLDLSDVSTFHDANGGDISITSDDGADAMERTIQGIMSDGRAVTITVVRGSDWVPSIEDLENLGNGTVPEEPPLNFVPTLAYASTSTTLSLALRPIEQSGLYRLQFDDTTVTSEEPAFTLTGLRPGGVYDLHVTADGQSGYQHSLSLATLPADR
jgi:hypothetical protein